MNIRIARSVCHRSWGLVTAGFFAVSSAFAVDWNVPLGTSEADRTVSGNATYDNITTAEKIIVGNGAKLATADSDSVYFTVAADAVAGTDGVVDIARIEGNGVLAPMKFRNQNANPARIMFAGAGATLADDRTHYYLAMFTSGPVVLKDETGDGIRISQTANYGATSHSLNTANVPVEFVGSGDVTFSRVTGWTTSRQSWSLNAGVNIHTTGDLYFSSNRSGTYRINGNDIVGDSVTGITVSGPAGNETENYACYLEIASGYTLRAKNFTANFATRGRVLGAGTLEMGADDANGTFDALVRDQTLTLKKIGAGALTVASTVTNIPSLVVSGGTVNFRASCPIGNLSIAEGANLVVDGATVVIAAADEASVGRVSTLNGGKVIVPAVNVPAGVKVELRGTMPDDEGLEYLRTGEGTTVVFGDTCPATSLHAKGGTIMFSAYGMTDRFLRFTFKRTWGWLNYSNVRQDPSYLRLVEFGFYDPNGARIFSSSTSQYDVSAIAAGSKAVTDLTGLCAMAQEGTVFGSGSTHNSMTGLFNHNYEGWYPYFATTKLDDDAFAAGKFERFYFHSRETDPRVHGYNMASTETTGLPRTWTIEASPTGEDDSWYVVSEAVDYRNGNPRDDGWLNGVRYSGDGKADQGLCMVFTNYVSSGVLPNAHSISVEVENGARIDFRSVTGGQTIDRIAYDVTTGGGVINAARLDETGVLELNGEMKSGEDLNLRLTNVLHADNITNWKVRVAGRDVKRKLRLASDGTLGFALNGLILICK